MARRQLATARTPEERSKRELEDLQLVIRARNGDQVALDALIRRYTGFVRLKASSYFLAGGESDDLIQEGLIGLYKAVRDFRADKETSFRSFAELCITRQIITAIKTATRFKHAPLNTLRLLQPDPGRPGRRRVHARRCAPGPRRGRPRGLRHLDARSSRASSSASAPASRRSSRDALRLYLEGNSYEEMAEVLGCDTKTIDNALQRVKRKVLQHQSERQVIDS